ncbi:MAG: aldose epimerase family protein [Pseudomonadota bacterium]
MDSSAPAASGVVKLLSPKGLEVSILSRGATIAALKVPAGTAKKNVVLGYTDLGLYDTDPYYLGATVGRYANRIGGGRFALSGETFQLATQENGHCLHGGVDGLNRRRFALDVAADGQSVTCRYVSPDGDQGFPGTLEVIVRYEIVDDMSLAIAYEATTDRTTIVNLTNHAYFNLEGDGAAIDDHYLSLNTSAMTEVDDEMIPTGALKSVGSTALDFRAEQRIGDVLNAQGGIDTNFVIDRGAQELVLAGTLYSPKSGVRLAVQTTQPGVQVFTGQNLVSPFRTYGAVCLETQNFPDAPNHTQFPSATLEPGDIYRHKTILAFTT